MVSEMIEFHKNLGIEYFNATWQLIDKTDRTPEDDYNMILTAQASRFHWGFAGTQVEFQTGDWLISKVYYILGHKEECMFTAKRCLDICVGENIGGFNLAFAYESMARAYKLNDNIEKFNQYQEIALEKARLIENDDDRSYTISEIEKNYI